MPGVLFSRSVLLPLNHASSQEYLLDWAIQTLRPTDQITLCTHLSTLPLPIDPSVLNTGLVETPHLLNQIQKKQMNQAAQSCLSHATQVLQDAGFSVSRSEILYGSDLRHDMLKFAHDFDLVLVGSKKKSFALSQSLGDYLIQHLSIPVLVAYKKKSAVAQKSQTPPVLDIVSQIGNFRHL